MHNSCYIIISGIELEDMISNFGELNGKSWAIGDVHHQLYICKESVAGVYQSHFSSDMKYHFRES